MANSIPDDNITESTSFIKKIKTFFGNEIVHFIFGLFLIMFTLYMLITYLSFFITGGADQSVIESLNTAGLDAAEKAVSNAGGEKGAQLANWLTNGTFGAASFFIIAFTAAAGIRLMKVRALNMWRWFFGCSMLLIWFSLFLGYYFFDLYKDTYFYLGGKHGYYTSEWLSAQIGASGLTILLVITALYMIIFFNKKFIHNIRDFFKGKYLPKIKKLQIKQNMYIQNN